MLLISLRDDLRSQMLKIDSMYLFVDICVILVILLNEMINSQRGQILSKSI